MTPEAAIADLDAALARRGRTVTLQRLSLGPGGTQIKFEVKLRAQLRRPKASPVSGLVVQQDVEVILSPTEINRCGWPGPRITPAPAGVRVIADRRIPIKGDRLITSRGILTVEFGTGVDMNDVLVRIKLLARGNG